MIRLKQLLVENNKIQFPVIINHSFSGDNGDRSHAFQSTGGVVVGEMQTQVNQKLKEIYDAGYNPDVTNITVTINMKTKKTLWEATINESTDGNAYLGIVTVGSCCSDDCAKRADDQVPRMKTWNSTPDAHKLITILQSTAAGTSAGGLTIVGGKYKLKQYFYKYTLKRFPPKSAPYIDVTYTSDNPPYADLLKNPRAELIASVLKQSPGIFNDYEAWAEAAFMAIKTKSKYEQVSKLLEEDPYAYVLSFMSEAETKKRYHKQPIYISYFLIFR
jgi:hypothetical protein